MSSRLVVFTVIGNLLGRFNSIDPAVDKYAGWSPYNFAFNDPVGLNDPDGADPNDPGPPWASPSWTTPGPPPGYSQSEAAWSGSVFNQFNPELQAILNGAWTSTPNGTASVTTQGQDGSFITYATTTGHDANGYFIWFDANFYTPNTTGGPIADFNFKKVRLPAQLHANQGDLTCDHQLQVLIQMQQDR